MDIKTYFSNPLNALNPLNSSEITYKEMKITEVDFKKVRSQRQDKNDVIFYDNVLSGKPINWDEINKNALDKHFNSMIKSSIMSFESLEGLISECRSNAPYCLAVSTIVSKKTTRQCTKDEALQLCVCNDLSKKFGIKIKNLPNKSVRFEKNGRIITNEIQKKEKINTSDCLASFDGQLEGKMNGYISSKITFGEGGYQNQVVQEMYNLADKWKENEEDKNKFLVIIIDTDVYENIGKLKDKYRLTENIIICNHVEFQKYIIDNYSLLESI